MDELDFLDGPEPAEQTAAPAEPTAEAAAEPQEGQARGPDGKFVAKAADAPAEPVQAAPEPPTQEAAPPPPAEPAVPPGYVPVGVLQELRKELQELRRQPAAPPPDPYEDPEGAQAYALHQQRVVEAGWSRKLAIATHGEGMVTQAQQWAAERAEIDPIFRERSYQSADPYGFAITEWKRDQVLSRLDDPKLFDAFLALANGQATAPAPHVAATPQPPTPPRSLASAPNAGGTKPGEANLDDEAVFGSVFKG